MRRGTDAFLHHTIEHLSEEWGVVAEEGGREGGDTHFIFYIDQMLSLGDGIDPRISIGCLKSWTGRHDVILEQHLDLIGKEGRREGEQRGGGRGGRERREGGMWERTPASDKIPDLTSWGLWDLKMIKRGRRLRGIVRVISSIGTEVCLVVDTREIETMRETEGIFTSVETIWTREIDFRDVCRRENIVNNILCLSLENRMQVKVKGGERIEKISEALTTWT
jgi:hypothetical protein